VERTSECFFASVALRLQRPLTLTAVRVADAHRRDPRGNIAQIAVLQHLLHSIEYVTGKPCTDHVRFFSLSICFLPLNHRNAIAGRSGYPGLHVKLQYQRAERRNSVGTGDAARQRLNHEARRVDVGSYAAAFQWKLLVVIDRNPEQQNRRVWLTGGRLQKADISAREQPERREFDAIDGARLAQHTTLGR
jgi:hypothetical protein